MLSLPLNHGPPSPPLVHVLDINLLHHRRQHSHSWPQRRIVRNWNSTYVHVMHPQASRNAPSTWSNITNDAGPTATPSYGWQRSQTSCPLHSNPCAPALRMEDVKTGWPRSASSGRTPLCHWASSGWWTSYMIVICPKKNGKPPRRTVDFQPLNKHATRETHPTHNLPSSKLDLSPITQRNSIRQTCSMLGMNTTAYRCTRMTDILQH